MEIKNTKVQDLVLVSKVIEILNLGIYTVEDINYTNKLYTVNLKSDLMGLKVKLTFLADGNKVTTIRKTGTYKDSTKNIETITNIIRLGKSEDKYIYLIEETENREDTAIVLSRKFYEGDLNMPFPNQEIEDDTIEIKKARQRRRD